MRKRMPSPFSFPALKKDDTVIVTAGKEKGKSGKIIKVDRLYHHVYVENINMIKKAIKPSQTSREGGFMTKENFLDASNVMLECPHCHKPTRISHKIFDDGKKSRVCKKCNEVIDQKK